MIEKTSTGMTFCIYLTALTAYIEKEINELNEKIRQLRELEGKVQKYCSKESLRLTVQKKCSEQVRKWFFILLLVVLIGD